MNHPRGIITRSWLVLCIVVVAMIVTATGLHYTLDGVIRVFGRWDMIVCSFLSALPLAALLAAWTQHWHHARRLLLGTACLMIMIVITIIAANLVTLPNPHRFAMTVCRGTIAFAAMLAPLTAMGFSIHASQSQPRGHQLTILTMLFVSAFVIPATYVDAIADGLGEDLKERLGSRRFGSAHRMAFQLCQLDPSARVNDRPVQSVQQELEEIVHDLNQAIEQPIQPGSSFADRGQRLTLLMCLDRNSEALSLLEPMTAGSDFQPIALDYQGLCHQRLEQYERSEAAYRKSVAFWQNQPPSQRQQNSLASAWKGIGYAMRRLNRRTEEEQAYRTLVEILPTGENNLLLAQCYREHQKTKLASQHAAIAMELNPNLREQSESVLSSMMVEHFGCLQVPRR